MNTLDPDLGTLARADADALKAFSETLIADLGDIEVIHSRTGLVMLPMRDTAQGAAFHLGEVLVSEAHIQVGEAQGYGMRRGFDLEAAMAMALVDAALQTGVQSDACAAFCAAQAKAAAATDDNTLRSVEATRVNMETF